jgi:hypothetical protein
MAAFSSWFVDEQGLTPGLEKNTIMTGFTIGKHSTFSTAPGIILGCYT